MTNFISKLVHSAPSTQKVNVNDFYDFQMIIHKMKRRVSEDFFFLHKQFMGKTY